MSSAQKQRGQERSALVCQYTQVLPFGEHLFHGFFTLLADVFRGRITEQLA